MQQPPSLGEAAGSSETERYFVGDELALAAMVARCRAALAAEGGLGTVSLASIQHEYTALLMDAYAKPVRPEVKVPKVRRQSKAKATQPQQEGGAQPQAHTEGQAQAHVEDGAQAQAQAQAHTEGEGQARVQGERQGQMYPHREAQHPTDRQAHMPGQWPVHPPHVAPAVPSPPARPDGSMVARASVHGLVSAKRQPGVR